MVTSDGIDTICLIGLGQMGIPMGANLVKAGHRVIGCDLSAEARALAEAEGLPTVATPVEAAADAGAIITMLPNGRIVRDALLGENGALTGAAPPSLVIDMSSSAPTDTVALGKELSARGVALIDAPVSGGRRKAVDGTLTIMVGGPQDQSDRAHPLLRAMGERIFMCGALGTGHAMKALNNYVSGAGAVAAMEAVILGRDFGLDPETMVDILNVSTGRNNTTEAKMKPFVLARDWSSGFGLKLMAKDIGIADGLAAQRGVALTMLSDMAALWAEAADALPPDADHTEIFRFLEDRAKRE